MIRIPVMTVLKTRFGEPFREPDPRLYNATRAAGAEPPMRDVTLGAVLQNVLDVNYQGDQGENMKAKQRRWDLLRVLVNAEENLEAPDLLPADVEMLKERVFKASFNTTIFGQIVEILDEAIRVSKEG